MIHVGLGIALAARYGALGMAEAVLIGVVLMEGMLMLPLVYRRSGTRWCAGLLRTVRILGLPTVVTAGLAWAVGRGGGPLYAFTASARPCRRIRRCRSRQRAPR